MDYFGARYFIGAQGRFNSPDSPFADQHVANPQSWNLYSYVLNNPLRYVDPNGRGVLEGLKRGIDATGIGFISLALQPDRVAARAWNAVSHPGQTISGIGAALGSFWHSSADEKVTSVVSFAVPAVLGGAAGAAGAGVGAAGSTSLGVLGEAATTNVARGLTVSAAGGIITDTTNAAGGTVVTSAGPVLGSDFTGIVQGAANTASYTGAEVNVLTGVHGFADGTFQAAPEFLRADQAAWGNIPGVNILDFSKLSTGQVNQMANGPGTTIGAFCNSGACIAAGK